MFYEIKIHLSNSVPRIIEIVLFSGLVKFL